MATKPIRNGRNMLQTISADIESLRRLGKTPSYVIIHENDTMSLMREMMQAKILSDIWKIDILEIEGLRIIRTKDISEGAFDVVV